MAGGTLLPFQPISLVVSLVVKGFAQAVQEPGPRPPHSHGV